MHCSGAALPVAFAGFTPMISSFSSCGFGSQAAAAQAAAHRTYHFMLDIIFRAVGARGPHNALATSGLTSISLAGLEIFQR